jgi:hypothetical protein
MSVEERTEKGMKIFRFFGSFQASDLAMKARQVASEEHPVYVAFNNFRLQARQGMKTEDVLKEYNKGRKNPADVYTTFYARR